jgi:hypothetical protein
MTTLTEAGKTVYLIVHGQRQLLEKVQGKLVEKGFKKENMKPASLEKVGSNGEYTAMVWPPMSPQEIIVSEIDDNLAGQAKGMGAWSSVGQKELYRIPL